MRVLCQDLLSTKKQKKKKEIEEFRQLNRKKQKKFQFQNPKQNKRKL